jgi:hypothetical protein
MHKDVIISVLGCGGKMSCQKEALKFTTPPLVVNVNSANGVSTGGATAEGFKKAAAEYKKNGSIIDGVLSKYKVLPNRICLISFLHGCSFIHEIMKYESERVDTVIFLEGPAKNQVVYKKFKGNIWIVNSQRFDNKISKSIVGGKPTIQNNTELDKKISIYSKNCIPKTKIYHEDIVRSITINNNKVLYLCEGSDDQDSIYIQQYIQPVLWSKLNNVWSPYE